MDRRAIVFEALGTALLLAAVVGSGIMGERLSPDNLAVALLANTLATGAALAALIVALGPISGAEMNPVITLAAAVQGSRSAGETAARIGAQIAGAFAGVLAAHAMFGEPLVAWSRRARPGAGPIFSEFVATFGLLLIVLLTGRSRSALAPLAIAAFVVAGYWFTASTCFANPAVTLARSMTDTFTGIRPADVPGFLAGEVLGAGAAWVFYRWLGPAAEEVS